MNLLYNLPTFSFDLFEIIPEKVLLKMNCGEYITINGKQFGLTKIQKYRGINALVEYVAFFDVYGKTKKMYVMYHGGHWMIAGHLGKNVDWLNQILRDIESIIIVDKINEYNPFHDISHIYEIYTR